MKNLFTLCVIIGLWGCCGQAMAQDFEAQAEKQTREMAAIMKLNEAEYMRLKNFNLNRLHQLAALANLREQDGRYLDMRIDLIEEEYASVLYNTFTPKQYAAYKEYRKNVPESYAGLTMKNNAIAVQKTE